MKFTQTPTWVMAAIMMSCHITSQAGVAGQYHQPVATARADVNSTMPQTLVQSVSTWLQPLRDKDKTQLGYRWIETNEKARHVREQNLSHAQQLTLKTMQQDASMERVVAPNGMFRRVDGAVATPYGMNNGAYIADNNRPAMPDHNLLLTANVPMSIPLADGEVLWRIRPLAGGETQQLQGRSLRLSLPDGQYDIGLMVGGYEDKRLVEVHYGRLVVADFSANIGVLRVSSDVRADWEVFALQSGKVAQQVFSRGASNQLSVILPVGEYEVVAHVESANQRQRLRVDRGTTHFTVMNVPTGKVNLVATLGNAPALRPMQWKLYRVEGNGSRHEVAAPARHSATLDVPPGHYEAVANLDGRERRREFTVLDGTSNSVVLAMD